jgi:iron complex outermembrane receptor protein
MQGKVLVKFLPARAGLAVLGLLHGLPCLAATSSEADFLADIPLVFTVSRLPQTPQDAPAAVTVIDRDMIRASGFRDIPDLLRLVPGFSVAYTRDNTWAAGYHGLADAFSRRFQVLVDGRSIYSPHFGAVYWTDLPLSIDDIERIEVVRGPNAASYGANAFVAVINIITRTAAQAPGEFVSMQYGEQGMRGLTARHGGGDGAMSYRLTVSAQQRDRFETSAVNGDGDLGNYFEATKTYFINGRMDWQLSPGADLMTQFGLSQGDWKAGQSLDASEPVQQDSRAMYLHLKYRQARDAENEWQVQFYHTRNRFDAGTLVFDSTFYVPLDQYLLQTRTDLEFQSMNRLGEAARVVWGAELRHESVSSPLEYNTSDTLDGALGRAFVNLEWRPAERWAVHGGAMLEHHYYTGTDISPRAAVNFTLAQGHVLRAGISRALRSPTFFEQEGHRVYRTTTGAVYDIFFQPAASDLAPESIVSREIGYVGSAPRLGLEWDARLFHDEIDDYIGERKHSSPVDPCVVDPTDPNGKVFCHDNGGGFTVRGGEFQLRFRPNLHVDITAHFTRAFNDAPTDKAVFIDDDVHASVPRDIVGLLAAYRTDSGWETSLGAYYTGRMKWLSDGDETLGYTRVDARLAKRFKLAGAEVEAAVVGQALDGDYSEFRVENVFSPRVFGSLSFEW